MDSSRQKVSTVVGIVDIGIANLGSIDRTLCEIAEHVTIVREAGDLVAVDRLVLPGVGAFPVAMERLAAAGLVDSIRHFALVDEKPVLGICLGMQLLASTGEEHGLTAGLDLIGGKVRMFRRSNESRVPHVGWNSLSLLGRSELFDGVPEGVDVYFIHSYVLDLEDRGNLVATSTNGETFTAAVQSGSVMGVQFHPEKSSHIGRHILRNFCECSPC
jgi:glutamine amidotransferase